MVQKTSIAVVLVGVLAASSFIGAAAFTTASAQRDVTVGIEADDTAIIGLQPGTADAASLNGDSQLVIEPEGGTDGLNQDATFAYGDDSSASAAESSNAFRITNNDDASHDFTLGYSQSAGSGTVEYVVAHDTDGDGTADSTKTVTSSASKTVTLGSGETAYVVVNIDTSTGTTNIQGTFSIDAN